MTHRIDPEHWIEAIEGVEKMALAKGEDCYKTLEKEYYKALKRLEADLSSWYQRLAVNNNISLAEVRKFLVNNDLKEFKWTVEEYIQFGEENAINQQWMKQLENASAKFHISRLESIKIQLQQLIEVLYNNQVDDLDAAIREIWTDTYYHTAFEIQKGFEVGWSFPRIDEVQLTKVLAKPWAADNFTFGDKIWKRKNELNSTVQTQLIQSIIRGDSPDRAIKFISEKFEIDKRKAGRLIMTESAYFAADAQKECYKELDIEQVQILATLDSHTSELCQKMDGKIVDMVDYRPGITVPPFHPWCRSTTVPYFPDNYGERAARGRDGKTYYVPSNMNYEEWKEKFVNGN